VRTLADLETEFAALPDPTDVPMTLRAQAADAALRSSLRNRIRDARRSPDILAEWEPKLASDLAYRDILNDVRERLCAELLALAKPRTDHEFGVRVNVRLSIAALDRGAGLVDGSGWSIDTLRLGALLREAGTTWRGSLPEVERRIRDAQSRVNDARHRLAQALRDPEVAA
jgi:hypothetical protein